MQDFLFKKVLKNSRFGTTNIFLFVQGRDFSWNYQTEERTLQKERVRDSKGKKIGKRKSKRGRK